MPPRAKPHSRTKEAKRILSPDDEWAEAIVEQVLAACHPKQRAFVLDPGRRVSALCARGAGKTTAGLARFVIRMVRTVRAKCLFIAQTKEDARELIWDKLIELVERLGMMHEVEFNETRQTCTFLRTGSRLKLVGADDDREVNKLRGKPHHEVGIDETAVFTAKRLANIVYRAIGPRLGDYNGCIWMVSTPGHTLNGLFYDATRPGSDIHRPFEDRALPEFADWIGWSSHAWGLRDGAPYVPAIANLLAEALVEKAANGWSDDNPIWLREYEGKWAADGTANIYQYRSHLQGEDAIAKGVPDGTPWNQWDPKRHGPLNFAVLPLGPDGKERKDWMYGYGFDMGSKDPFALNIFAWSPSDSSRTLYHVFCFDRTKMYANLIAKLLIGDAAVDKVLKGLPFDYEKPGGGCFQETGWPTAMMADLAALGEAVSDELRNIYGVAIERAEKTGKHGAIELLNGDLVEGRVKILKGSKLEDQLMLLQWTTDEFGVVKEPKGVRNDHADSAIYIRRHISGLLAATVAAPPSNENKSQSTYKDPMGLGDEMPENDNRGEYDSIMSSADYYGDSR